MHVDRNLLIAGVGLTVAIGLTTALFIWPNYSEAAAAMRERDALHNKMKSLDGQSQAIEQLQDEVSLVQRQIDSELKEIPDLPDVASVIRKLSQQVDRLLVVDQTFTAGTACDAIASQAVSSAAGGRASQLPPKNKRGPEKDACRPQSMPLSVDMEATFDSLFALIQNAESLNRLVRVTNVRAALSTMKTERQPGDPPLLKAAVGLEIIYMPASPARSAAAGERQKQAVTTQVSNGEGI